MRKIVILLFVVLTSASAFARSSQRIVSLAPSLTKMVYLVHAQNELVGCTSYCEEAIKDHKSVVATAMDVNVERVFQLKPDLVITTTLTKPAVIASLEKLGIKVKVYPQPQSYVEVCSQFIAIAQLIGKEPLAKSIVSTQQQRLSRMQQSIPKGKKPRVFFELGAKPLFTVIPNTFMNDYITYSGGLNIAADLKKGSITRENVIIKDPEAIFIVTMGIVGTEEKTIWEKYSTITAAKRRKIFIVDSNKACSPNPVTFVDVVEQLITMLYK
jgi:iron complex transport system substrate-binding protein